MRPHRAEAIATVDWPITTVHKGYPRSYTLLLLLFRFVRGVDLVQYSFPAAILGGLENRPMRYDISRITHTSAQFGGYRAIKEAAQAFMMVNWRVPEATAEVVT